MEKETVLVVIIGLFLLSYVLDAVVNPLSIRLVTPYQFLNPKLIMMYPFTTASIVIKGLGIFLAPLLFLSFHRLNIQSYGQRSGFIGPDRSDAALRPPGYRYQSPGGAFGMGAIPFFGRNCPFGPDGHLLHKRSHALASPATWGCSRRSRNSPIRYRRGINYFDLNIIFLNPFFGYGRKISSHHN